MPHNTLRFQGGVIEQDTPVINTTGIAVSNRVRFKYDPLGMSLPEKLGGWAQFLSGVKITGGVVRVLWAWEDTNAEQWLGFATDNLTNSQLWAIQGIVQPSGLTSATGSRELLSPTVISTNVPVSIGGVAGFDNFIISEPNMSPGVDGFIWASYITASVSVGGIVLQGMYRVIPNNAFPNVYNISASDVLGNPVAITHDALDAIVISSVTFASGTPNTLTFTYTSSSVPPPLSTVNVIVADNSITGIYEVISSSSGSFVVATTLGSYTFSTTGTFNQIGSTPYFSTVLGSSTVTVLLEANGFVAGQSYFYVLNPTAVGGLVIEGQYLVQSVIDQNKFTIMANIQATATASQWQGAILVTGGTGNGTHVTLTYPSENFTFQYKAVVGQPIWVSGVVPSAWNGWYNVTSSTRSSVTFANTTTGTLATNAGTISPEAGLMAIIYSTNNPLSVQSTCVGVNIAATAGSNVYVVTDPNFAPKAGFNYLVAMTAPVSVGGVIISGNFPVTGISGITYQITVTDPVSGNPINAVTTTYGPTAITNVVYSAGTLIVSYTGPKTLAINDIVTIVVADGSISNTYQVLSSTSSSFVIRTGLTSYTFSTTGTWNTNGSTRAFSTTGIGSSIINVGFADHGLIVGQEFLIQSPTSLGGVQLFGPYFVASVIDSANFTFDCGVLATYADTQYEGALNVTGGSGNGSDVILNYTPNQFGAEYTAPSGQAFVSEIIPNGWAGNQNVISSTGTSLTFADTTAGAWGGEGAISAFGGLQSYNYYLQNAGGTRTESPPAEFWTLDNWGNDLIACSGNSPMIIYPRPNTSGYALPFQPIWYWDSTSAPPAQAIVAGPPVSNGAFVAMPQRQIIAWGSSFSGIIDPLLIRWCDVNNFNTWVAQTTNQAGSFRLPSGGAIIGARQVSQQGLIWTDIELWGMQYISQPYVYGFNKLAQGCGLIGKYAHGVLAGITYWMSKTQFFMLSGNGVVAIPCPIWDVAFQNLDLANVAKITCAPNSMFQEIAWYFPVKGGTGENSQYVKLNVAGLAAGQPPLWDYGTLDRSAWIDVSILQQPIGFSPVNQYIYQHEISPDADGAAMGESFTTGWFALADADVMPYVDQIWPDFKWGYYGQTQNASLTFTLSGQDFPGQSAQTIGPYTINQATTYISPRMRHRMLSFTVSGTGTGTWWRLGGMRFRYQPDGKF